MIQTRVCDYGGLLVDGNARLPSDRCEYYDETSVRVLVGCSRLRCARCGEWVRGGPPGLGLKEGAAVDVPRLYAAEEWAALPFVERRKPVLSIDKEVRLYACRCLCWEAVRVDCIENEHDSSTDPNLPWACAGHPLPELPCALGELVVGVDTDWAQLVGKVLGGVCPRPLELAAHGVEEGPSLWLGWLYAYLAGSPLADKLSSALAQRIDDSDPQVVGRVLYFFARFARAEGVERLIAHAEADISRVAIGYPIPEYDKSPTLWDVVVGRLEQRTGTSDALDKRAAELLRRVLLAPLSSLSHEDLGPASLVDLERQSWARFGRNLTSASAKLFLEQFARLKKSERIDVVVNELARFSTAFDDAELRLWIADHIVEIDAAAPGRWRPLMNLLTDWYGKPELGHLIVVAGMRVIESRIASVDEFRDWMKQRGDYGWVDDAWVLPLTTVLDQQASRAKIPR